MAEAVRLGEPQRATAPPAPAPVASLVTLLGNAAGDATRPVSHEGAFLRAVESQITATVRDEQSRRELRDQLMRLRQRDAAGFERLAAFVSNNFARGELASAMRDIAGRAASPVRAVVDERAPANPALVEGRAAPTPALDSPLGDPARGRAPGPGAVTDPEQVLATNPQYRTRALDSLRAASRLLTQARAEALRANNPGLAAELDTVRLRLETALHASAGRQPAYADVPQALVAARAALQRARDSGLAARGTAGLFDTAITDIERLGVRHPVDAGAVARGARFLAAYRRDSMQVLDALLAQPVTDFNLGDVGSGRIRTDDAMHASLRLNTALWTVQRDIAGGSVLPARFGRSSWNEVTPGDMYQEALRRLREGNHDWSAETRAMVADATIEPLMVRRPGAAQSTALRSEDIDLLGRSVGSLVGPSDAALELANMSVSRSVAEGAAHVATVPDSDVDGAVLRAQFNTAYALFTGSAGGPDQRALPPNASQMRQALMNLTGIGSRLEEVRAGETVEQLRARGAVVGGVVVEGSDGRERRFAIRPLASTAELVEQIRLADRSGNLAHLDPETLARVRALAGRGEGALAARESREESERWWRETSGAVVGTPLTVLAALNPAMRVGRLGMAGVQALGATGRVVTGTGLVGTSLAMTGISQGLDRRFDAAQYPIDLATMGLLSRAGVIATPLSRMIGGNNSALRRGAATVATGVALSTLGAGVGVGVNSIRSYVSTGAVDWNQQLSDFYRGAITGVVLHHAARAITPSASATAPRPTVTGDRLSLRFGIDRIDGVVEAVQNGRARVRIPGGQTLEVDVAAVRERETRRGETPPAHWVSREVEVPPSARAQLRDTNWRWGAARRALDATPLPVAEGMTPARGEYLGSGQFSNAWLSRDGAMVVKEIQAELRIHPRNRTEGGPTHVRLTDAERAELARETVRQINILRDAGFPVPRAWVSRDNPFVVVQQRAPGVTRSELPPNLHAASALDYMHMRESGQSLSRGLRIDQETEANNVRFNRDGSVAAWFDPAIPLNDRLSHIGLLILDW